MSSSAERRLTATDLARVAVFAGIIAALGLVPAITPPFTGAVPVTAQSMGVMLAGLILGARRGAASVLLLLALVAIGLPLLAGGRGGLSVFAGPTVGYLVFWPISAWVTGWLTERGGTPVRFWWGFVAAVLGCIVVLYAGGIAGMVWKAHLSVNEAVTANWVFIPGDLVKAAIAALVAVGVHRGYPGLIRERRTADRNLERV